MCPLSGEKGVFKNKRDPEARPPDLIGEILLQMDPFVFKPGSAAACVFMKFWSIGPFSGY